MHPDLRGRLVVLQTVFLSLGMLIEFIVGYFYTWRDIAMIATIPVTLLTLSMFLLPETPYWLIEKNQSEAAKKSLLFFRGPQYQITQEFQEIEQNHLKKLESNESQSNLWALRQICSKAFLKPYSCIGVIFILYAFTGFDMFLTYLVFILRDAGSSVDPEMAPMIVMSVRVLTAAFTSLVIHKISLRQGCSLTKH